MKNKLRILFCLMFVLSGVSNIYAATTAQAQAEFSEYYTILTDKNINADTKDKIFENLASKSIISDFDRLTLIVFLAEKQDAENYSFELKKILLKIPYMTPDEAERMNIYISQLKRNFSGQLAALAFNKITAEINTIFKNIEPRVLQTVREQKPVSEIPKPEKTIRLNIAADWFEINDRYRNEAVKYDFINKLRHSISLYNNFSKPVAYSITGDIALTGKIEEFEFMITETAADGRPFEMRLKVLYNYELLDKISNKLLIREVSKFRDFIFKTKNFSEHTGLTEREAADELVKLISAEINNAVNRTVSENYNTLTEALIKKGESVTGIPSAAKKTSEIKFYGKVESDYEFVSIDGNFISAGETKKETGRLTSKQYLNLDWNMENGGALKAGIITKYNNYLDKRKDIEKLYAEYKKDKLTLKFGNLFTELSKNIFNNSYEGVYLDYQLSDKLNFEALAGREKDAHDFVNFLRLNAGFKTRWNYSANDIFSLAAVIAKDDDNSISFDSAALTPVKNSLISFTGLHKIKSSTLDYEFASSVYDENTLDNTDDKHGKLVRINNLIKRDNHRLNFEFLRVGADYYSANAILTADRQKYAGSYETVFCNDKFIFGLYSLLQNNNLEKNSAFTEYLKENTVSAAYIPFLNERKNVFNSLRLSADYQIRDNYNKMLNNQPVDKDLKNHNIKLKIENRFFERALNCALLFENEKEDDAAEKKNNTIKIYEANTNYSGRVAANINFLSNLKYRYKSSNTAKDRFINGGSSLKYFNNEFSAGLNYYIDLIESSVQNNDISRQKIGANVEYSFKKDNKNIALRAELFYEINDYERSENDYNKLTLITGAVVSF